MDGKHWLGLYSLIMIVLLAACATPLRTGADPSTPQQTATTAITPVDEAQANSPVTLAGTEKSKDEELFLQVLHQLAVPLNEETSANARQTLETLLSGYPQSKWNNAARATLRLIGELDVNRQRFSTEQALARKLALDRNKTLQENEQLKKELRLFKENSQAELAGLQEENEQLKKDLQLLKNLEIQLDRREKTLR